MRILISNDSPTAHYYIRMGIARAFTAAGHEAVMWDINQKPVYDAFDEFNPDIFIGQTYNINEPIIKCIEERPHLKVIMKAGDWGPFGDRLDREKFPLHIATEKELLMTKELASRTGKPDYLYIHYHPDALEQTHGHWIDNGFSVCSQLNAADVFEFTNGQKIEEFRSDIAFVGGYWGYKSQVLDKFLLPLCENLGDYNIKIFGNQQWPVPQYCGFIDGKMVNDVLASAAICPNLSEPHSQEFGFDIVERPFKLLSNKCFVISDYVEKMEKVFGDSIVYAKTPEEFKEKVDYYLNNPEERQKCIQSGYEKVINEHTYFDRVNEILLRLNMKDEADKILQAKGVVIGRLSV